MKVIVSIIMTLFIIGCSQEAPKEEKVVETKKVENVAEKSTLEKATDTVKEAKEDLSVKVTEVKESLVEKVKEVKVDLKEKATESKEAVKETTSEVVDTITDKVAEVTGNEIDADLLWNKCSGCHGGMGERAALGKSGVIRNWSVKQIEHSLHGYQDGTYGRSMKEMMQSQVRGLSDAEISAIARYISDK